MKVIGIVVIALALLGGGAGAGYWLTREAPTATETEQTGARLRFYPMDRFIVSVGHQGYSRYLVLDLSLATHDNTLHSQLETVSPLLRNVLVQHFARTRREQAQQMFEDVPAVQGQLLSKFNQVLEQEQLGGSLDQVLVTNVFIQ